eukprot:scaffold17390_cov162-Skeletonema_dohrnii-CCMP3373.AAC.3
MLRYARRDLSKDLSNEIRQEWSTAAPPSAPLRKVLAKIGQVEWTISEICYVQLAIFDECLNFWCNRSKREEIRERKCFSPPERCGQNRPREVGSKLH